MSNFNIKMDNIQINKARIKLKVTQYAQLERSQNQKCITWNCKCQITTFGTISNKNVIYEFLSRFAQKLCHEKLYSNI